MIANTGSQASRSATHRPPVGAISRPGTRLASRPTELTVMNAVWCHRPPCGQRAEQIRTASASVASIEEAAADPDPQAEGWLRVDLRAERLDWVPAVLASLDRPFVIERPDELRGLVVALAERLAASARSG